MTQNIKYTVFSILYDTGNVDIQILTPAQYAGMLRRKGFKKSLVSKKKLATLTIKIETK